MRDFEYAAPTSVAEAVDLLSRHNGSARPLAGGTDLIDQMRIGRHRPNVVVDLKNRTAAKPGNVNDVLIGVWNAIGSQVNDTLTGDDRVGGNWLSGQGGGDRIFGLAGNDYLQGDSGDDFIDGGIGSDQIYGGLNSDVINGGNDDDLIYADDTNDTIGGAKEICNGMGIERVLIGISHCRHYATAYAVAVGHNARR